MKILHRFYPCNTFLSKFKENFSSLCSFCNIEDESLLHLFYNCPHAHTFWVEVSMLIYHRFNRLIPITEEMVLFLHCVTDSHHTENAVKLCCILGKFHIHKARVLKFIPNFHLYRNELRYLANSMSGLTTYKKGYKTHQILNQLLSANNINPM